jgi:hypothetical protein
MEAASMKNAVWNTLLSVEKTARAGGSAQVPKFDGEWESRSETGCQLRRNGILFSAAFTHIRACDRAWKL